MKNKRKRKYTTTDIIEQAQKLNSDWFDKQVAQ